MLVIGALFVTPRLSNHLSAETLSSAAPTPCMYPVYNPNQSYIVTPPVQTTYTQPQTQTTNTNQGTTASVTASYNAAYGPNDDPLFAQRQFDDYYKNLYPNYGDSQVSPTQNQYTNANGYGYVTTNPASENDPSFAQKQFDSYYSQLYPNYYTNPYGWQ